MQEINFTSTYRIPITQAGVNSAKKAKLKELIQSYPNGLIGNSKVGNARVSMPDSEDATFIQKLKTIGYKVYQKFEGENIPKENLDVYIKERLDNRTYNQAGKNMKRMSRELKEKRRYERRLDALPFHEQKTAIDEIEQIKPEQAQKPIQKPIQKHAQKDIQLENEKIKKSPEYLKYKEQYGEEFADALFFGIKK